MPDQPSFQFDPKRASAFVEGPYIYYSPNSTRPVPAPRQLEHEQSPFNGTFSEREHFVCPVWWTDGFGWIGYIPLAPSFIATPFHHLCWLPKVHRLGRDSFQMDLAQKEAWKYTEKKMTEACHFIRLWYGIAATTPRHPSEYGYLNRHKTSTICKRRIQISRDWFVVWFGFLSFLLAEAERRHRGPAGDFPDWYMRLKEEGYSDSWLAGLMSSTVYSFTACTPRVGIFVELSRPFQFRPTIDYLLKMHIPVWLVWTKRDEALFLEDRSLVPFAPPVQLLLDALEGVYRSPYIPSAREIFKIYYNYEGEISWEIMDQLQVKHAPEVVFKFLRKKVTDEYNKPTLLAPGTEKWWPARPAPPDYPQQGMVDRQSLKLQDNSAELFPSWEQFFEERERCQAELIEVESAPEQQARLSRERSRGIKKARVFTWEKIVTSGGQIVYARVAVPKSQNEDVLEDFTENQRRYNAFSNEWDVCADFAPGEYASDGMDSDDSDGSVDYYGFKKKYHVSNHQPSPGSQGELPVHTPPRLETPPALSPARDVFTPPRPSQAATPHPSMEIDEENAEDVPIFSLDIVESIGRQYGYISPLGVPVEQDSSLPWWKLILAIGIVKENPQNIISDDEKAAIISFFGALASQKKPHCDLWDLDDFNRASLNGLARISDVGHCSSANLFIFSRPASMACRWILGLKSAAATLYVVCLFVSNPTHNILTVARLLISCGVPFYTFLHLRDLNLGPPCLSAPFAPTSVRFTGFKFTPVDFEAAMIQCRQILNQPQGRAALLMGGILWHIAKQYLSLDGALTGPSIEVTVHRMGECVIDEKLDCELWDDGLTPNEMRVICGSYKLLTGHGMQDTIKSWFPPHETWSAINTSGLCWMEWTQVNEEWFISHLENIRTGKFEPLTAREWREKLRMVSKAGTVTRKVIPYNEKLACEFLDEKLAL